MPMTNRTVCFFNTNPVWGGGENWHASYARLLRDRGWPVLVVARRGGELAERLRGEPGITLHETRLGNLSFLNPLRLRSLSSLFRRHDVGTVLFALPSDMKAGGLAARMAGVPRIIYRRGIAVPVKNSALNRWLFRSVITDLIVNSRETLRTVLENNPDLVAPERIHHIPNGIDVPALDRAVLTADAKEAHGETLFPRALGELRIGTAGRLTEQKGHRYLLEAAQILKKKEISFTMFIAGKGELQEKLEEMATKLDVADVVRFPGFVEDLPAFYRSLDVFVLPSLWEGFGYVLAEAMTLRLPTVAFNISNIPELCMDGETGLLVPPHHADALAEALETLLRDPDQRARMGEAGRARIIKHFGMERTLAALEALLEGRAPGMGGDAADAG